MKYVTVNNDGALLQSPVSKLVSPRDGAASEEDARLSEKEDTKRGGLLEVNRSGGPLSDSCGTSRHGIECSRPFETAANSFTPPTVPLFCNCHE